MAIPCLAFHIILFLYAIVHAAAVEPGPGFGQSFWGVRVGNGSYGHIKHAQTTLVIPSLPEQQGLFLWPGMYTDTHKLVQTLVTNDPEYLEGNCGIRGGNQNLWCALPYTLNVVDPTANGTLVREGELMNIDYWYDETSQNTTQTGTLDCSGQVITKMTAKTGPGFQYHQRVECHGKYNTTTPAHTYLNTTIELSRRNPYFKLDKFLATPSEAVSNDGGRTWFIPRIDIAGSTCEAH